MADWAPESLGSVAVVARAEALVAAVRPARFAAESPAAGGAAAVLAAVE